MGGLLELLGNPAVGLSAAVIALLALAAAVAYVVRDVSARRNLARLIKVEKGLRSEFETLLTASRDGVVILNSEGVILLLTDVASHILGLAKGAIGTSIHQMGLRAVDEKMRPVTAADVLAPGKSDRRPRIIGVPGRRGPEDIRWVHVRAVAVPEVVDGTPATLITLIDASGIQEAAEALSRKDSQFRKAVENAPLGLAIIDLEWRIVEVNRAFAELIGSPANVLRGMALAALSHPHDIQTERDNLQRLYDGLQNRFTLEKRYVRADGNVLWAVLDCALVRHPGGAPDHYVIQLRDSTDDRLHSELMAHRAMHDPLTGLANRTLMQDVLQQVLEQPDAVQRVGVIAVDLDGFKGLNDRFGHAAGDNALVHVAGVLRAATAGRGTVARIGGDEFVIVVQDADASRALFEIAGSIHQGLKRPLQIKRHQLNLHASVGIAMADEETIAGGAPSLLSAADAAMYRAKAMGKSRTEVYDSSMKVSAENQSVLAGELAAAIDQGQLVLHYQPVMELEHRTVVGYEALVRWQHPTRGLLLPGAFLGLLEDRRIATQLGTVLVEQAAKFLVQCPSPSTWVSLNVSADQLGDSEFANAVFSAIARHHLSPGRMVVELTEASLVAPNTRVRHELTQLRNAGVPILLDDFGTGVSPLSYLRDLPVSGVKLDMSFVAGIPEDPAGARVSRALGALARELGLATIAEGIETESQAEFLSRCGWRHGQGWLFGVAQPAEVILGTPPEHTASLINPHSVEAVDPFAGLPPLSKG